MSTEINFLSDIDYILSLYYEETGVIKKSHGSADSSKKEKKIIIITILTFIIINLIKILTEENISKYIYSSLSEIGLIYGFYKIISLTKKSN